MSATIPPFDPALYLYGYPSNDELFMALPTRSRMLQNAGINLKHKITLKEKYFYAIFYAPAAWILSIEKVAIRCIAGFGWLNMIV